MMTERRTWQGGTYERAGPGQPWQLVGQADPWAAFPVADQTIDGRRGVVISNPQQPYDIALKSEQVSTERLQQEKIRRDLAEADEKKRLDEEAKAARARTAVAGSGNVLRRIDEAMALIGGTTAGPASILNIPGSDGRDLQRNLDTIKANIGFDRLQRMREESPTGGALGQVAVQELESLQATIASLDRGQSPEQLRRNLQEVKTHYNNWLAVMAGRNPYDPPPGAGSSGSSQQVWSGPSPSAGGAPTVVSSSETRTFSTDADKAFANAAQQAFNRGAGRTELDAIAQRYGRQPFGEELDKAIGFRDRGGYRATFGIPQTGTHEPTGVERLAGDVADTWVGGFGTGASNALLQGTLDETVNAFGPGGMDGQVAKDLIAQRHPWAYAAGDVVGTGLSLFGANRVAQAMPGFIGRAAQYGGGIVPDAALGAVRGAGEMNENRLGGALIGGTLAAGGGAAGNYVVAPLIGAGARAVDRRARRMFGAAPPPGRLTPGEGSVVSAINRTGPGQVEAALAEAIDRRVPLALANVSPEVEALTGAALRRSPRAAGEARNRLTETGRGQYDRFRDAVSRNLGPVENIPERSAALLEQARAQAGPLYEQAYAATGANEFIGQIRPLLERPSMQRALQNARRIAAEEGRDPDALGLVFDRNGNVVLGQAPAGSILEGQNVPMVAGQPTWQTLDYVKRGMDDVVETYRDPATGRLNLDTEGRAVNNTLRDFLRAADEANPDYAAARAAYANPASETGWLTRGQDALRANPNELGVNTAGLRPERMEQMRLGFQSGLVDQAGRLRHSTNPFESVLGTPQMEQRLSALYGADSPGAADLLRIRDMERNLNASSNRLIGNSMTAERLAADRAFEGSAPSQATLDIAANLALGQVPIGAVRQGAAGALRDAWTLGLGNRAVRRAEEIVPLTTVPDPVSSLEIARNLMGRDNAYRRYLDRTTPSDTAAAAIAASLLGPAVASAGQP